MSQMCIRCEVRPAVAHGLCQECTDYFDEAEKERERRAAEKQDPDDDEELPSAEE